MPYLYLTVSVFMCASTSIFGKGYNRRCDGFRGASAFYNLLQMIAVLASWGVIFATSPSFEPAVLPYSLGFAACYTVCNIAVIYALKHGPASLTSLFVSLALILTSIWGLIFWDAKATPAVIIGLILVVAAIYLCLYSGKKEEKAVSLKWVFFALLAMAGNAGCSIVQRSQQMAFDGQHGNMLMLFASLGSAITCSVIFALGEKRDAPSLAARGWFFPALAGLCNVILNVFVIKLASTDLSPSLIYPTIGVGGLVVVILFSLLVYKEKLTPFQWAGIAVGTVATLLLSL